MTDPQPDLGGGAAVTEQWGFGVIMNGFVIRALGWMVFWALLGMAAAVAVWLAGTLSRRRRP